MNIKCIIRYIWHKVTGMAQIPYKIDLQHTEFPLLTELQTRTVIAPERAEITNRDDLPAIAYCHNVMPTKQGVVSIGYEEEVPNISASLNPGEVFTDIRRVVSASLVSGLSSLEYLGFTSEGRVFWLDRTTPSTPIWKRIDVVKFVSPSFVLDPFPVADPSDKITVGTVNQLSYIYYANKDCYIFDLATQRLIKVVLQGLVNTEILGVAASSGYLVAYNETDISWSSTIDPTDFVPSQVTGAGGGTVSDIEGDINFILSNSLGLMIYSEANTVAGTYTGNSKFPFRFRAVDDSKGGISQALVASEVNAKVHYAYTKAGLQTVNSTKAETILPQSTDFFEQDRYEDYIESTDTLVLTEGQNTAPIQVKYIASRYLVISYGNTGTGNAPYALVLDVSLGKLGKLKKEHIDVFEYPSTASSNIHKDLALLEQDGTVSVVTFSPNDDSNGVIILGKLQAARNRMITMHEIAIENVATDSDLVVIDKTSLDGKNTTNVPTTVRDSDEGVRTYVLKAAAKNHSITIRGKFNLTTLQILYSIGGRR